MPRTREALTEEGITAPPAFRMEAIAFLGDKPVAWIKVRDLPPYPTWMN